MSIDSLFLHLDREQLHYTIFEQIKMAHNISEVLKVVGEDFSNVLEPRKDLLATSRGPEKLLEKASTASGLCSAADLI